MSSSFVALVVLGEPWCRRIGDPINQSKRLVASILYGSSIYICDLRIKPGRGLPVFIQERMAGLGNNRISIRILDSCNVSSIFYCFDRPVSCTIVSTKMMTSRIVASTLRAPKRQPVRTIIIGVDGELDTFSSRLPDSFFQTTNHRLY